MRIFAFLSQLMITLVLLVGCAGEESTLTYPPEPEKEYLYDTSLIHKESQWGTLNGHDPSIFKDGDTYYTVSTDVKVGGEPAPAIQMRQSTNLIDWEYLGTALDQVPEEAYQWTGASDLWAPDIVKMNDKYYLYYSASTFGSNQSMIGLLVSDSMEGPWEDHGVVIKSASGDEPNAIDPAISFDREGNPWMVYGSFFGGIYIVQLDPETGKPIDDDIGQLLVRRPHSVDNAVEGPYIIFNGEEDKYYLFVSYDSLFTDYNIRVARSDEIYGPYVDYAGNDMTDTNIFPYEVGTKIMGGYRFGEADGWVAPGHNSVLNDDGDFYLVHHARGEQDPNWPYMHVRKIVWTEDGWPLVSPERYAGEKEQPIVEADVIGDWDFIMLSPYNNDVIASEPVTLDKKGSIKDHDHYQEWSIEADNQMTITYENEEETISITGKVLPAWDWAEWQETIVFTGLDENGTAYWGKKQAVSNPDS